MSKKTNRVGYEFSLDVKIQAFERSKYRCEVCGKKQIETPENCLDIHHILGICLAKTYFPHISKQIIASLANAEVVCKTCHDKENLFSRKNYAIIAQALLGLASEQGTDQTLPNCRQVIREEVLVTNTAADPTSRTRNQFLYS